MSELEQILNLWKESREKGEEICLATVVGVEGSSYRKPGARMLITRGGRRAGTISGGCLEAEVQKKAWWLTESGPVVQRYSSFYDEDSEMPYGLGCGGTVSVLLERGEAAKLTLNVLEECLNSRTGVVFLSAIDAKLCGGVGTQFALNTAGDVLLGSVAAGDSLSLAKWALNEKRSVWEGGLFADYVAPRVGLLAVGAGDDALPLVEFAARLGWHTTVVDGRSHLATRERFPMADRVIAARALEDLSLPDLKFTDLSLTDRDAAVILTHSYEQDRAALRTLLPSAAGYLGMLGPRQRTDRLLSEVAPDLGLT
ncbi:MAG TPA: XdhC family protein, partial [Silvibacterium sp.]|nr:XdhC family protein [Silvibacterium sp.]